MRKQIASAPPRACVAIDERMFILIHERTFIFFDERMFIFASGIDCEVTRRLTACDASINMATMQ
jgi:hypothetical protein